ncbi:MAG: hypothetical protein ACXVCY_02155 [Pseudobdellovibrionaceae bacterium]
MKRIVQTLGLCALSLIIGCKENSGYRVEKAQVVKVSEFSDDIKIPAKVWDMLELKSSGEAGAENHSSGGHSAPPAEAHGDAHGSGAAPSAEPSVGGKNLSFSEITVILAQKNSGIIKDDAVKIFLPKGGGEIDLSQYVTGKNGSFFVGFDFPPFEGATGKKVVFISDTKKRKIGGQIFGAGCNRYFDITEKFLKEMKGEGIKVNTTQERYISVLGGTFLLSAKKNDEVHVARISFKNSQFPSLFCKEQ